MTELHYHKTINIVFFSHSRKMELNAFGVRNLISEIILPIEAVPKYSIDGDCFQAFARWRFFEHSPDGASSFPSKVRLVRFRA